MPVKTVSFKKKESEMLEFLEGKDFSYYVKDLIKKDMQENYVPVKKEFESKPKERKNANYVL